jgi:N-acetylneuraminic acid mutarotase
MRKFGTRSLSALVVVVTAVMLVVSACGGGDGEEETSPLQRRHDARKPTPTAGALMEASGQESAPKGDSGSFVESGLMTNARADFGIVTLEDGRLVAMGGRGKGSDQWGPPRLDTAEIYDPGTGVWTEIASMGKKREALSANLLGDGRVLVTGGRAQQRYHKQTELWDREANSWTKGPNMKTPRWQHAYVTLPDGRAIVIGGTDDIFALVDKVEVFDPPTDEWTQVGSMAQKRALHTSTLLPDGRVLVTGGGKGGVGTETVPFDTTEIWDPATGEWSAAGTMTVTRARHAATLLDDGRVLVTGSVGEVTSAEIWDPASSTWSSAGSMSQWRAQHTATLLPDGRVLVTGGLENGDTTEIFDPATGAWSQGKKMNRSRYAHQAVLLKDGTVLLMAGQSVLGGGDRELTNTTEIFTP